jgi:N-acetyltransferase 10
METVEGGGIIVLLLKSVSSLRQLFTMSMDVHARFRTEAHADVIARLAVRSSFRSYFDQTKFKEAF